MRFAPTLIGIICLVASTQVAHAERTLSLDFGYLQNQIAVTDETAMQGSFARFGIKMSGRHLHAGVEAEEGWLTGQTWEDYGYVARMDGTVSPNPSQAGPLTGNTIALKTFGGAHGRLGPLMLGADLAIGFRDTWVSSDRGNDVAGRKNEPLLEARTRIDYWLSQSFTLGVAASTDLNERRHTSVGAILAIHFPNLRR